MRTMAATRAHQSTRVRAMSPRSFACGAPTASASIRSGTRVASMIEAGGWAVDFRILGRRLAIACLATDQTESALHGSSAFIHKQLFSLWIQTAFVSNFGVLGPMKTFANHANSGDE